MLFTCQRTGKCCTHPQIVVTLTHKDLWILFQESQGIDDLKSLIQFMVMEQEDVLEKLVLSNIKTLNGNGIFILRKNTEHKCIFYDEEAKICNIHSIRPQACRNFPFAFNEIKDQITVTLVKNATSFCMGIGKGKDYTKKELLSIGKHTLETIKEYNRIVDEINKESYNNKSLSTDDALMTLLLVAQKNETILKNELQVL